MDDRGHLSTEQHNPRSARFHHLSTEEAFDLINGEDATVAGVVAAAKNDICRAIGLVVDAFRSGGRLIYAGAGTSGRLGVLDAAECPPTFLSDPRMVQGVIAGGAEALTRSVEGAEDRPDDGATAMDSRNVDERDVVFGIATGGTTPFVHGALERARQRGARTVFLACVTVEEVQDRADVSIRVITGPEILTGSTRLKAGTATKMILNMVTTIAMSRIGKVHGNLMVDVNTRANAKLVDRGIRILQTVTGLPRADAAELLERSAGRVKTALVMHFRKTDRVKSEQMLRDAEDMVSGIIDSETNATDPPRCT